MLKYFSNRKFFLMTTVLLFVLCSVVFLFGSSVLAQINYGVDYAANVGLSTTDIRVSIINIIRVILGVLGILALIIILYGGFVWMTSQGDAEKIEKAKKILLNAVIGLIIIMLAFAIVQYIFSVLTGSQGGGGGPSYCVPNQCYGCMRCQSNEQSYIFDLSCNPTTCDTGLGSNSFVITDFQTSHGDVLEGHYESDPDKSNVKLCSKIQAVFNHNINPATAEAAQISGALRVAANLTPEEIVAGDFKTVGGTMIFTPPKNSEGMQSFNSPNTDHSEYLPSSLEDTRGRELTQCSTINSTCEDNDRLDFRWDFYVGNERDDEHPTITSTYPQSSDTDNPDTNVDRSPIITVRFNEAVDATTVLDVNGINPFPGHFYLYPLDENGNPLNTPVSNNILIIPSESIGNGFQVYLEEPNLLEAFTYYEVQIQGITDLCGNLMSPEPYIWRFATNNVVPGVNSYYPTGDNVCPDTRVSISYNTSMYFNQVVFTIENAVDDPMSSFILEPSNGLITTTANFGNGTISGTFHVVDVNPDYPNNGYKVFEFIPDAPLPENTGYYVTFVTDKIINVNGDHLEQFWDFTVTDAEKCVCTPHINSLSRTEGPVGECLTISGYCFMGTSAQPAVIDYIHFNNTAATIGAGYTANSVGTIVPDGLTPDSRPQVTLAIAYASGNTVPPSNPMEFYVTNGQANGPCLWSVTPNYGKPGTATVTLRGIRFGPYSATESHPIFSVNRIVNITNSADWGETQINNVPVPLNTVDGDVVVRNSVGTSNGIPFNAIYCGDNQVDPGEQCDGTALNNKTCATQGFVGGTLVCANCLFDTTGCSYAPSVVENGQCQMTCVSGTNSGQACSSDTNCPGSTCAMISVLPSPNPFENAKNVCLNAVISADFNTDLLPSSINGDNIYFQECPANDCAGLPKDSDAIGASLVMAGNRSFRLTPTANLSPDTTYQVTLKGGSGGIASVADFPMQADYVWQFTTQTSSTLCPFERVYVEPKDNTLGDNDADDYLASAVGSYTGNCQLLNGQSYVWAWSVVEPTFGVTVTNINNGPIATVHTATQKGTTYIRAETEGKSDQGRLNIDFDTCTSNEDCTDPNNDGTLECPGSTCDIVQDRCTPVILDINPDSGPVNRWVTLLGCHFKSPRGSGHVDFRAPSQGTITVTNYPCNGYWTDTEIIIGVPELASQGYVVNVTDKYNLLSNDSNFTVTNTCAQGVNIPSGGVPGLCSLAPNTGVPGTRTTLTGENFGASQAGGNDNVVFSTNQNAAINSWGSLSINATVPANIITGPVNVTVDNCPSNSLNFTLNPGRVGDPCDGNISTPTCEINNNLCWPGLYCRTQDCTCQPVPQASIVHSSRFPNGTAQCRNTIISGTFDRLMNRGTLNANTVKLWQQSSQNGQGCFEGALSNQVNNPGAGSIYYLSPFDNLKILWSRLVLTVVNFFKQSVQAQQQTIFWCPVKGAISSYDVMSGMENCPSISTAGCTVFKFSPSEPLTAGNIHEINLLGGANGIKSAMGGQINTNANTRPYQNQPSYYWSFNVADEICEIVNVKIDISFFATGADGAPIIVTRDNATQDYFACADRDDCPDDYNDAPGNQHGYLAQAYDKSGVPLSVNYNWSEFDAKNLIEVAPTNEQNILVTPNPVNGESIVRVKASDPNPEDEFKYGSAITAVGITNFLCQNPWPPLATFPYDDTDGDCSATCDDLNFSTFYCRDYGHDEPYCSVASSNKGKDCLDNADCPGGGACLNSKTDDLPNLVDNIKGRQSGYCVGGNNHGDVCTEESNCPNGGHCNNVLKEFMFTYDDGWCSTTARICTDNADCPTGETCEILSDSIGIRIYRNDEHLSPSSWYEKYANQPGSYSRKKVDGYEAISSGRTNYITMANDTGNQLYTDMFLLSYTDKYDPITLNIHDQLLENLKFNTNGIDDVKLCSTASTNCEKDSDCPAGETCDADKTKLARDTIRMGHLNEMIYHLDLYRGYCSLHDELACLASSACPDYDANNPESEQCVIKNNTYPTLTAGTYISGQSTSVWDSWSQTFASLLGTSPLNDPLNEVFCDTDGGFNDECWNEENAVGEKFQCNSGSHMYHYVSGGSNPYTLYSNMEYSSRGWQPAISGMSSIPVGDITPCNPGCYNLMYNR